ncbi:hypothetical protein [Pseudovibrio brasiliensis]|uniref:Uncharacterized protein n=1 Tax=Pseudovibrio brasiliensis TaxID=1898042 RepID=A0ABX8AP35_9HYPH|nr:hypothetical protein [Pseudovibrio brasiliensis]QUS56855.1 hypothetical protein KGB56_05385 [Pseudovibrio brasiliensis]
MLKPKGCLTDVVSLPSDKSRQPQTVLMLDRLTHIPVAGDMIHIAGQTLLIAHVDKQQTRHCLTGWNLIGRGSIAVLVNEPMEKLSAFARQSKNVWITWTPQDELPWHFKTNDLPTFSRLNEGWNADPNDAGLRLEQIGSTLLASMRPNFFMHSQYKEVSEIIVSFADCSMYRVTGVNDEGWYKGQCRFSGLAPSWGEFYEISGNTRDDMNPTLWTSIEGKGTRHFHFYLKDEALEVKARDWLMIQKSNRG